MANCVFACREPVPGRSCIKITSNSGMLPWLAGAKGQWGEMRRTANSHRGPWHP
jgi:hypothetical protein